MTTTAAIPQQGDDPNDAHNLMPASLAARIPALYATEGQRDEAIAHVKLFTPDANWTWYVVEYDPSEQLCYGLVVGLEPERGYFSLDELRHSRGPMGLRIERDLWWQPMPLREVLAGKR